MVTQQAKRQPVFSSRILPFFVGCTVEFTILFSVILCCRQNTLSLQDIKTNKKLTAAQKRIRMESKSPWNFLIKKSSKSITVRAPCEACLHDCCYVNVAALD